MIIAGIDVSKLGDQFGGYVPGQTLIMDFDGPCYVAASTSKTLATSLRKAQSIALEQMFLTKSENASLHLTSSTSTKAGRYNIIAVKPYQGNRDNKPKPALLEATRQAVANPANWLKEYEVVMHHNIEADDGMITEAYQLKEHGLIWSGDKDLRLTPYQYWDIKQGRVVKPNGFGSIHMEYTPSGTAKCLGYGLKFFWAQMLMGDTADNVAGLLRLNGGLCGAVGAFNFLDKFQTECQAANQVIAQYRKIDQNPIPEGWMLWLLRRQGDTFWQYLNELEWTPENRAFLDDCVRRTWFKQPEKQDAEFEDAPF